jgi:SPP1 family predicted phage head-tail adaptor
MNIGRMRELVTLQIPSSSASTDGDYGTPTWKKLATVHADISPLPIRERLQAAAMQSPIAYRVRLRDRADVTAKARIICAGPDYAHSTMQIHSVVRNHRDGSLELDCSEVLA